MVRQAARTPFLLHRKRHFHKTQFVSDLGRQKRRNLTVHDFLSRLKSCSRKRDLQEGRLVHKNALETGHDSNRLVAAALIDMYAKCGNMIAARQVFDSIVEPDVVSWTALILGYAENGEGETSLELFSRMTIAPNSVTYVAAIKACASLAESEKQYYLKVGKTLHSAIGHHMNRFVQNTLINMYAKCGSMVDARTVFENMEEPNVVSWNALILGYAGNGEGRAALDLFSRMKTTRGCAHNSVTCIAAIKACISLVPDGDGKEEFLKRGREIHLEIGNHMNGFVQSALIKMYAKLGSMVDARLVFDSIEQPNVASWNALILGYAENGEAQLALTFFSRMKTVGVRPESVTYGAAIKACTSLTADGGEAGKRETLKWGRIIHSEIGRHMDHFLQNALINMYTKCGSIIHARRVFDSIEAPSVISWTALILGYADNGEGQVALDIFSMMKTLGGCSPNSMTYVAVLQACNSIGALAFGRKVHSQIIVLDVHVVTCLIDFYAKCGSMVEAQEVFDSHSKARNTATWNALLAGYGSFGDIVSVFNLFEAMQDQGFRPNSVTFVCMLSCCSHAGVLEKAREYLEAMPVHYEVTPNLMHYSCIIDGLGRANQVDEAASLLQKMPCNPDAVAWTALLGTKD